MSWTRILKIIRLSSLLAAEESKFIDLGLKGFDLGFQI
jgi:hypothetical protein